MLKYNSYKAPFGEIFLISDDIGIKKIAINKSELDKFFIKFGFASFDRTSSQDIISQLDDYFSGKRHSFEYTPSIQGTAFRNRVWNEVKIIPYGETRSYSDISTALGITAGCRAVGTANGKNPLPILIPCHRVIGKNGTMNGYLGNNIEIKIFLLEIERKYKKSNY